MILFFLIVTIVLLCGVVSGLAWFSYKSSRNIVFVSENIGWLYDVIREYGSHLDTIFEMETYHGDQVIENLIVHTHDVVQQVRKFEHIYSLTDGFVEELEETEIQGDQNIDKEEKGKEDAYR